MQIITNNVPREILEAYELTQEERKEFDYLDWDAIDRGEDSASFFRYKGMLHDLGEFGRVPDNDEMQKWDGYISESFFSGILVKYDGWNESVVVGRYYT